MNIEGGQEGGRAAHSTSPDGVLGLGLVRLAAWGGGFASHGVDAAAGRVLAVGVVGGPAKNNSPE